MAVNALKIVQQQLEGGQTTVRLAPGIYYQPGDQIVKTFLQELLPLNPRAIYTIKEIEFPGLGITDVGAVALGDCIPRFPTLTRLELSNNGIGVDGARAIAKGSSQSPSLEHVILFGNEYVGPEGIKAFAEYNPPFLRTLDLGATRIGDEGMPFAASLLRKTPSMEELFLGRNGISTTGLISEALNFNSTLQTLDLNDNCITHDGIRGLALALYHNTHLRELELSDNIMNDDDGSCLMTTLSHNGTIDSLSIDGNYIDDELVNDIEEFASNREERRRRMRQRLSLVVLQFSDRMPFSSNPSA